MPVTPGLPGPTRHGSLVIDSAPQGGGETRTDGDAPSGEVRLAVRGEIVHGALETLGGVLAGLPAEAGAVVLDMAGVTFMDSTGLALLEELEDFQRRTEIRVRTVNWTGQPRRVLEFTAFGAGEGVEHGEPDHPRKPGSTEPPGGPSAPARERADLAQGLQEKVEQLQQALVSRPLIDRATGILMAAERCTAEDAWGILRETSQHANVKLRLVAREVVGSVGGSAPGEPVLSALRAALRRHRGARG
jgi:anti-anti-sigma factor